MDDTKMSLSDEARAFERARRKDALDRQNQAISRSGSDDLMKRAAEAIAPILLKHFDPAFARAVVLVIDHCDEEGQRAAIEALRPLTIEAMELLAKSDG